jgi:hypothetical protein
LFGPEFEPILNQDATARRLSVDTRLKFLKYCVPDFACFRNAAISARDVVLPDGSMDPRRDVKATGPYAKDHLGNMPHIPGHSIALTWIIRSSRFRPLYKEVRAKAGVAEFQGDFDDGWWFDENSDQDWRQRLLYDVMVCQGLEGLAILRPGMQAQWMEKIRE